MQSNRGPQCDWLSRVMLCGTRRDRLFVNGQETPYFIDTAANARHRQARGKAAPHVLYGSGQAERGFSVARSAGPLAEGAAIERLMHRAELLATS